MTRRKSDHLKLLCGTARRDRTAPEGPALPVLTEVPQPPGWLQNIEAQREWRRLASVMTANKLLTAGNISLLGQLCGLHGQLAQAWSTGVTPTAALIASYRSLSVALGLASMNISMPAAPGSVAPAAPPGKPNRFAELARRLKGDRP
jgi:hypothetical protein